MFSSYFWPFASESNYLAYEIYVRNKWNLYFQISFFLEQISGETASSTVNSGSLSDLSNVANASLYGFEDYHGVDLGVVRAVRLWYAPVGGELAIEIKLKEGDSKLGFAISRTEEVRYLILQFLTALY